MSIKARINNAGKKKKVDKKEKNMKMADFVMSKKDFKEISPYLSVNSQKSKLFMNKLAESKKSDSFYLRIPI